jgi:hypothetical protein
MWYNMMINKRVVTATYAHASEYTPWCTLVVNELYNVLGWKLLRHKNCTGEERCTVFFNLIHDMTLLHAKVPWNVSEVVSSSSTLMGSASSISVWASLHCRTAGDKQWNISRWLPGVPFPDRAASNLWERLKSLKECTQTITSCHVSFSGSLRSYSYQLFYEKIELTW